MKSQSVTIQMNATEQYSPVVLFIMLYKVALTFESVDKFLKCDHSKERYGSSALWLFIMLRKVEFFIFYFKSISSFE